MTKNKISAIMEVNYLISRKMISQRTLASTIIDVSATFPVLLLTGPRQVGKTTLLEYCAEPDRTIVSLDDLDQRALAQNDPELFLQRHSLPIIIDEVQYAPQLFSAIKLVVDRQKKPGLFWLTGSQKFHLMHGVSESLAGRVAILDLLGFSQAERMGYANQTPPFLPTLDWVNTAKKSKFNGIKELYDMIWRGSFPAIILNAQMSRDIYYNAYVQTYIQRDVRMLSRVGDEMTFMRFLRATAARTGQLLNYASLARDVDVSVKTIKEWLSILETSGLIFLLQPYHANVTNRMIKTPKLYFLDTGLCCYLTQWSTPEALEAGAMSGAILETYMFSEILKTYWHHGKAEHFYFYRDRDQYEIDLLIEQDGMIYPIEFKKTANPSAQSLRSFNSLKHLSVPIGPGAILCLKESSVALSADVMAIPVAYL